MSKVALTLTKDQKSSIHSMWVAYSAYAAHAAKHPNKNHDSDFIHDAFEGLNLFGEMLNIVDSWGPDTDLSFDELTFVFTTYMQHAAPDRAQVTLRLFATVFQLIAAVLERKKFIQQQHELYKTITDALGDLDGDVWDSILKGELY